MGVMADDVTGATELGNNRVRAGMRVVQVIGGPGRPLDTDVDALVVAEAYVGKSIVMKRFHARGRGRASRIEKPFSHLTIVVREVEEKGEAA